MSFSASPLVPDQATSGEAWEQVSGLALAAVMQALPQIPAADTLTAGEPSPEPSTAQLPDPAGAAIIGTFGGGVEGRVLLVVAQELVDALRLPSADIGRLTVGDVLTLGHKTSKPLSVTSANTTFALAVPGSSGKRLAALIVAAQT